jgi:excisionase family DNA binding protein
MTFEDSLAEIVRKVVSEELAKRSAENADPLQWLTAEEAAKRCALSVDTVRDYCAKGKLRASRRGGGRRRAG